MNEAMRDYWNGDVGKMWVAMQRRMDAALAPVGEALLEIASPQVGDHILDIGCGAGDTALALAARGGDVVGVDISAPLLALAAARVAGDAVRFLDADAATYVADTRFDLIVSRFGVMFFDEPVAAFAHIRDLATEGGRLVFACWRAPADNLWATLPLRALSDRLPPAGPVDPHAPGPFAFADPERVTRLLEQAGWRDIAARPHDFDMVMGSGSDPAADAADFSLRIGPAARAVADAVDGGTLDRDGAAATLAACYAPHVANGRLALPAGIWLVTARA